MEEFNKFIKHYIAALFTVGFFAAVFGGWMIFQFVYYGYVILLAIFFFIVGYVAYNYAREEAIVNEKFKINSLENDIINLNAEIQKIDLEKRTMMQSAEIFKGSLLEKSSGFPTMNTIIIEYEKIRDEYLENYLKSKKSPAYKAADIIKEEGLRRREAEKQNKQTKAIIEYYESIAPFLLDFKDEIMEDESISMQEYSENELQDPVRNFMTKEEYRKLSTTEKNQLALERYWKRPKSKWLLGRMYERYVGYIYEKQGYIVEYHGIFKGLEDLGRDLICHKGNNYQVVQCKNWSQFKTIHEKHIFQLFGTFFQYRDEHPEQKAKAVFYTTTKLSDLARRFAIELDIKLVENFKFDQDYSCIKCNIGKNKEKIYHLPFDQQYDTTNIEINKGEFYATTVIEAEKAGFRRAFRWHGENR
jgi:hypothetical protein